MIKTFSRCLTIFYAVPLKLFIYLFIYLINFVIFELQVNKLCKNKNKNDIEHFPLTFENRRKKKFTRQQEKSSMPVKSWLNTGQGLSL